MDQILIFLLGLIGVLVCVTCSGLLILVTFPLLHLLLVRLGKHSRVVRDLLRYYHERTQIILRRSGVVEMAARSDFSMESGEGSRSEPTPALAAVRCFCDCCSLRVVLISSVLILCFVHLALLGASIYVGRGQVLRSENDDDWNPPTITPPDFPRQMGCGGCRSGHKTDAELSACTEPCFGLEYIHAWEKFAKAHEWKQVSFPSRKGPKGEAPVQLTAWWLPADPERVPEGQVAPRIVSVHGMGSNMNHCGVQASCFLLRTMGFGCLTPSVRDYGLSGKSSHPEWISWGYDYQYDVLGAWDYAVNDPQGKLGGKLADGRVGVMGFSRGAMDVATAFGLEKRIPAAWIDSAPFTGLYGMVDAFARPYAESFTPLVREPVFWAAQHFSKGAVDRTLPLDLLTKCSKGPRRRLAVSQGLKDNMVPPVEGSSAVRFLSGLALCYEVTSYNPPSDCLGDRHHTYMWTFPDEARKVYCDFWSDAFGQARELCGIEKLPRLQRAPAADSMPPVPRTFPNYGD